ncbi:tRNA 2-thiouridine(34) synthase MnmA [Candidatus Palibaumannia cicadellinicola]|uniref:tRNA-specific 2-thiouridylase MnmA n=1 Tax=Candidatus Palibaumannia cicadellinicola TaxID=186490 RepID=A0A0K2BKN9_9GAMM|nr:tRNA 2-thiouridine(34) synthase MnmA [Candidatus Baumannia cicadellinicola]AKZ65961.1 tRNA-specific 2-thiouridylase [Candidatus Baumannia cicadellinicola]
MNKKQKVIVGMSGGVDSSVSALLLQQQGYQVEGLFMKNWEEDDNNKYCTIAKDLYDAQTVCDQLGIILHAVNFAAEYWDKVFELFLAEYRAGRTPNPDILCNKEIKFNVFLYFATKNLSADYIATGHYVRSKKIKGKSLLLRGKDEKKDQSYFLYTLGYKEIAQCLFPVGELNKVQVRAIAAQFGLATTAKKDSTGICFIGKRKLRDLLSKYITPKPGVIVTVDGKQIGYHPGLIYFTLGQRKGLGIGGTRNSSSNDPWYVVDKNIKQNVLIVAQGHEHPRQMATSLIAYKIHWVDRRISLTKPLRCTAKTRYRQPDIGCLVEPMVDDDMLLVIFDYPVAAVTPGQSVVLYLADICLGGGVIQARS